MKALPALRSTRLLTICGAFSIQPGYLTSQGQTEEDLQKRKNHHLEVRDEFVNKI